MSHDRRATPTRHLPPRDPAEATTLHRRLWGALALFAALGTVASVGLATAGLYPTTQDHTSSFGGHPAGWAGALPRLADALSYFTHWSNAVVAVAAWVIARGTRPTTWVRVLLLDALLMITITAIVYAVLLAPTAEVRGWENVTNPWVHIATPALTVLLWAIAGPRRWLSWRLIPLALVVPLAWVGYMLARGSLIDQYPYDFVDVVRHGYAQVALNVGGILVFGVLVAAFYCLLDAVLSRLSRGGETSASPRAR